MVTEREKEILRLLCLSNDSIAKILFITKSTVKTYIINLLNKLCASNRRELLIIALKKDIITLDEVKENIYGTINN